MYECTLSLLLYVKGFRFIILIKEYKNKKKNMILISLINHKFKPRGLTETKKLYNNKTSKTTKENNSKQTETEWVYSFV